MQWGSCPILRETHTTSVIVRSNVLVSIEHGLMQRLAVWSNFEIADMSFWRGEAYTKFFAYLDEQGGFYYEV